MGSVDDQTFRANFSGEGVAKLRDKVKDKLKEFMGDYTDDTLVDYIIVLLRNGRRKEEARNELNVFLGDDSDSFVSWLWGHLASDLNLYVHTKESHTNEMVKMKPTSVDQGGSCDSPRVDSESEKGKPNKLSRSRHNKEWKGLVRNGAEPPPLCCAKVDNIYLEEKSGHEVSQAKKTPQPRIQKKRGRLNERQHTKREVVGQSTIAASRRLLQSAVRDAVGTTRPSCSGQESPLKCLRSMVFASSTDSELIERPRKIRSVATVPNHLATVIKAVAEAAEDVTKFKSTVSVFDRLSRGMDVSEMADSQEGLIEAVVQDQEYEIFDQVQEQTNSVYVNRHEYNGQYVGNMRMIESDNGLSFDPMTDDEGYDDVNHMGHRVTDVSQSGTSGGNKGEDSLMLQYAVAKNTDDVMQIPQNKDHDQSFSAVKASCKMANFSMNVNTWKPLHYQEPRDVPGLDSRKSIQQIEAQSGKSVVQLMKEKSNSATVGNGNVKPVADIQKESPQVLPSAPGIRPAGHPLEDTDCRTIFVSNVHFAATKDSLSQHFTKFGEVFKVFIVADAVTGQPKGSAYVEFMHKEAADNALTLNGTSFMSRILKVVKRNAACQDAVPLMTWPRVARGSYAASRFTRASFLRGISGAFRPRVPIKPGARSLQWKRDAQSSPVETGSQVPANSVLSPTARSLTYVRTEPKVDGNSGTT